MPPPFLFARSRGLWEGEDGKNGRTKPDDSGKVALNCGVCDGGRAEDSKRPPS